MPKIAWAKQLYNAYHNIKPNEKIYKQDGTLMGTSTEFTAKPTYKSSGSVEVSNGSWISGKVEKIKNGWKLTKECIIS